jgi:hypothetical protein
MHISFAMHGFRRYKTHAQHACMVTSMDLHVMQSDNKLNTDAVKSSYVNILTW